jgi:hypothetical protein
MVAEMRDEMDKMKNAERAEYVLVKESSIMRSDSGSAAPTSSEQTEVESQLGSRQSTTTLISQLGSRQSSNTTISQLDNQYPCIRGILAYFEREFAILV